MATLPGATTTVSDTATAIASGTETVCVWSPQPTLADATPRQYGSAAAIYAAHGYGPGVEYAAIHAARTRKPILFCALPIATAGAVGREDTSNNTGTSVTSLAAGGDGVLIEHDGEITVVTGGTIGTDQIVLDLSLDGGRTTKRVRLGTASSYVIPYVGVTVSFAAGTLVAGDVIHTWHGSGPRSNSAGWALARAAMAAQQKQCRSIVLCGDLQNSTEALAFNTQLDTYESSNERFVYGRASVLERLPLAALSSTSHSMTGGPNVTFAEVGATGDTIVRSAGSWVTDGFATGDIVTISGSASNDLTTAATVTVTDATTITLDTDDLADEGPVGSVTITGEASLTFSDANDEITRAGGSPGSWLDDGFRIGDSITITGTSSNNITTTVVAVTDTVLEVTAAALSDEVIGITSATIVAGQTKAVWMAAIDAAFATVDAKERIDLSAGRGRALSQFAGWYWLYPAGWFASWREYQHDVHVATWRKSDGPVGADLYDADGNLVEWDDLVDGGAGSAARFTTLRTWANGPQGGFIALSLTRASDASLLSRTHNVAVVNVAQQVCQAATENVIGRSLILNDDGTATTDSLNTIKAEVNSALELALLTNRLGEGQRCSAASWEPATDDILNVPEPTLNGTLTLNLRGTIHTVATTIRVVSGGQ
jgi:hypothetical protein